MLSISSSFSSDLASCGIANGCITKYLDIIGTFDLTMFLTFSRYTRVYASLSVLLFAILVTAVNNLYILLSPEYKHCSKNESSYSTCLTASSYVPSLFIVSLYKFNSCSGAVPSILLSIDITSSTNSCSATAFSTTTLPRDITSVGTASVSPIATGRSPVSVTTTLFILGFDLNKFNNLSLVDLSPMSTFLPSLTATSITPANFASLSLAFSELIAVATSSGPSLLTNFIRSFADCS